MVRKINRTWRVVLSVVVLLVAFRLALPYMVTRYVNKVLNELEGYHSSFEDIDIHLYRGAYQIDSLKIFKIDGNQQIPFVDIPLTNFSLEWESLLKGEWVGEITFDRPVLSFLAEIDEGIPGGNGSQEQTGIEINWIESIRKLIPLDINRISIHDGKVAFYDLSTQPTVDLFLHNVELDALNLTNAKDNPEDLPSRVYLQASSIGNGQLNLAMSMNVLKEVPDLDMDLRFENVNMKALDSFFKAYANTEMEDGNFNLYSELAVSDGKITGYVRPQVNGLKVAELGENDKKSVKLVWESMVRVLSEAFENQQNDHFANKVSVDQQLSDPETSLLPAMWGIFSDSFVEAFETPHKGTISDANNSVSKLHTAKKVEEKKDKKDLRKEKRREKREQKKRARHEKKGNEETEKADKKSLKEKGAL